MEPIKLKSIAMPLRRSFVIYVLITFLSVAVLSGSVIWGCSFVRDWLLPDSDEVYLNVEQTYKDGSSDTSMTRLKIGKAFQSIPYIVTDPDEKDWRETVKFSITSVEDGFTYLSPKRKLLYQGCGAAMIALPVLFSFTGILLCGVLFYKRKLKRPLEILSKATEQISGQDLDFTVSYPVKDEFGALCGSFEQMRSALQENNRRMWDMLEQRKKLQASVAHDLRNPIAIIKGHAEYLRLNLTGGDLPAEKILSVTENIESAAGRLERYTDSIRELNALEEIEPQKKRVDFSEVYEEMTEALSRMAQSHPIKLCFENRVTTSRLCFDVQILYRILENLLSNALRYAKSEIDISFSNDEQFLTVLVSDDGPGFSEKSLKSKEDYMLSAGNDGHMGMGLAICRILCKKHEGSLTIGNCEGKGAFIKFYLAV